MAEHRIPYRNPVDAGDRTSVGPAQGQVVATISDHGMPRGNRRSGHHQGAVGRAADGDVATDRNRPAEVGSRQSPQDDFRSRWRRPVGAIAEHGDRDLRVVVRLQFHRHAAEVHGVTRPQQRPFADRPAIDMRAGRAVDHLQHQPALSGCQACVQRRHVVPRDHDRVAVGSTEARRTGTDQRVGMLAVRETESHRNGSA